MLRSKGHGWLLPDALIALSLVSLSLTTTSAVLSTARRDEQRWVDQVHRARQRHDQVLANLNERS